MNNSDKTQKCTLDFGKVKKYEVLYGNDKEIPKCDAAIFKAEF